MVAKRTDRPEPPVAAVTRIAQAEQRQHALISATIPPSDPSPRASSVAPPVVGEAGTEPRSETSRSGLGSAGGAATPSSGAGLRRENGKGAGSPLAVVALTQASYRDTPRPDYPESARRQGKEGKVILRVLVDDQGWAKRVEINSSSGSEVLDHAAAAAIHRWRFHPARRGDQPVESWLRVPMEFRLADTGRW